MDTIKIVNSTVWLFAIVLISFVLIQATVFLKKALRFNSEHKLLTKDEVNLAVRTGVFSIIGPAFSVMIAALSLMAIMGSGASLMRIGVIGSANYEIMLSGIAADTLNVQLGSSQMTVNIFVLALFAMILGSAPYFINCLITLKPMEKSLAKAKTNKGAFANVVGFIASMALMSYFGMDNLLKGRVEAVVLVVSALTAYVFSTIADKTGNKKIFEWLLAIGLVAGLSTSIFLTQILGW